MEFFMEREPGLMGCGTGGGLSPEQLISVVVHGRRWLQVTGIRRREE